MKVLKEIAYIPFRKQKDQLYYFDEDGIVQKRKMDALPDQTRLFIEEVGENTLMGGSLIATLREYFFDREELAAFYDNGMLQVIISAAAITEPGESVRDFERHVKEKQKYYDKVRSVVRKEGHFKDFPSGLDRFLVRIEKPLIIRWPDNPKPNTFDIIKVRILLCRSWESNIPEYVKENEKEIINRAIEKIEKDRSFKKYGVPVNILAMTSAEYLTKDSLELIFEIKQGDKGKQLES